MCYMRMVTHREMRNSSGEILRAVAAGEDVLVTNHGQPAALITRPPASEIDRLRALGATRPARQDVATLRALRPKASSVSTQELLADLRGDR